MVFDLFCSALFTSLTPNTSSPPPATCTVRRVLFCEGADGGKLFLQVLQVVEFGIFADLDEAETWKHFFLHFPGIIKITY